MYENKDEEENLGDLKSMHFVTKEIIIIRTDVAVLSFRRKIQLNALNY